MLRPQMLFVMVACVLPNHASAAEIMTHASSATLFGLSLLIAPQQVDAAPCPAGTTAPLNRPTECVALAELQVGPSATFHGVAEFCNAGESCDTCCTRQGKTCNEDLFDFPHYGTTIPDPQNDYGADNAKAQQLLEEFATETNRTCSRWQQKNDPYAPFQETPTGSTGSDSLRCFSKGTSTYWPGGNIGTMCAAEPSSIAGNPTTRWCACATCLFGTVKSGASCTACPDGQISNQVDVTTCTACSGATPVSNAARTMCVASCPPNWYASGPGQSGVCTACANGRVSLAGSTSAAACQDTCTAGSGALKLAGRVPSVEDQVAYGLRGGGAMDEYSPWYYASQQGPLRGEFITDPFAFTGTFSVQFWLKPSEQTSSGIDIISLFSMSIHDPSNPTSPTAFPHESEKQSLGRKFDAKNIASAALSRGRVIIRTPDTHTCTSHPTTSNNVKGQESSCITLGMCIISTATYTTDKDIWRHWAFTWSSAGVPKFYRDGLEQATEQSFVCKDDLYTTGLVNNSYTATEQLASHPHVVLNIATQALQWVKRGPTRYPVDNRHVRGQETTAILDEVRVFSSVVTSFQSTQQLTSGAGLLLSYMFDQPERLGFDSACTATELIGDGGYGYGFGDASVYYRNGTDENGISRVMSATGALCGATQVACCIPLNEYGPPDYYYGAMTCTNDNKEGSSCGFTCEDGYYLSSGPTPSSSGVATRTCTAATSTIFSGDEVICTKCPIGKYKNTPTTCATLSVVAQDSARITALESTPVAAAVPSSSSTSGGSSANYTTAAAAAIDTDRITALESTQSMAFVLIGVLFCLVVLSVCMLVWMYKGIKKNADQLQLKVTPGAENVDTHYDTPHKVSEDV